MDMNLEDSDGNGRTAELRAFLLGTLPEPDVERLEYSLLSHDGLYELLLAMEEELIDEYLCGSLTQSEASTFLAYLEKVPGGVRQIDFARDFRKSLETSEALTPTGSRWQAAVSGFASMWRWQRPAFAASSRCSRCVLNTRYCRPLTATSTARKPRTSAIVMSPSTRSGGLVR